MSLSGKRAVTHVSQGHIESSTMNIPHLALHNNITQQPSKVGRNALPLSSLPYFDAARTEPAFAIRVYADVVEAQALKPPVRQSKPSTRKAVRGFSDKSRKNMIDFLAKVVEVPDLFVTMTYSDDIVEQAHVNMHTHFEAMRRRLERAYAGIRAMWRIEFVPRKSGKFTGMFQPHFHLLIWLHPDTTQHARDLLLQDDGKLWRGWWHEITGSQDEHHLAKYGCQVQPIQSRRHAYAYASKYLAKSNYEDIEAGRRWGKIGEFEQPIEAETTLTSREYVHFKRLLNAFMKSKSPKFYKSFRKLNINTGSSVYGLGFISQDVVIGNRTIYKMLRHARELANLEFSKKYINDFATTSQ